jgi:hypothetical protein
VPLPTPLVVKNGSKMRDCTSAGIPEPLSAISTRTKIVLARRADGQVPVAVHGVGGVVDQVGPDLIEFDAASHDLRKIGREVTSHGNAALQFVVHDGESGFDTALDVHVLHGTLIHVGVFFDGFVAW